jgi:integrase
MGMARAGIRLIDIEKKHMLCDDSYKQELHVIFPEAFLLLHQGQQAKEDKTSEKLSVVAEAFWKEKAPQWKPRSKTEYATCPDHMIEFLGAETQLHSVGHEEARGYKKALMEKSNEKGKPLSNSTNNMYLGFASSLFGYARKNHHIDENPFEGLSVSQKMVRVDELRDVFDQEDMKRLFCDSREYSEDSPAAPGFFWIPILALYTGCRLEELCQLYISDVRRIDGLWCLSIEEDRPDKSVKTGEKRVVPLHPFIAEDLNFIEYVKTLTDQEGRVFPHLKRINDRYGHYFSRWFGTFKKKCGVVSGKKAFHSFRHTLINHLKQAGVAEPYIAEFVGHRNPSMTTGRYGKKFDPGKLYEQVVLNLDYGIDLSHLKKSKYVVH